MHQIASVHQVSRKIDSFIDLSAWCEIRLKMEGLTGEPSDLSTKLK